MAISRRRWLLGLAGGLAIAGPVRALERLVPTPSATAGPFYPTEPPLDDDNDLTVVQGADGIAKGEITELSGRLLDTNGRVISGGRLEIWQCDANGRYHHPRDRGPAPDANFQGFGHTLTDGEGRYRFRTIKPVPYPGRTPHIHMAVYTPGRKPFVTQLYVDGESRNQRDFLYRNIPDERRARVTSAFVASARSGVDFDAVFDVILGITPAG